MMHRVSAMMAAAAATVLLIACGNESQEAGGGPSMTPSSAQTPGPTVVSSDEVTWRDGSLGCPEPGMFYTQALIPGTRTILEVAGKQYHYHSGGNRAPFLCENPQPPVGG